MCLNEATGIVRIHILDPNFLGIDIVFQVYMSNSVKLLISWQFLFQILILALSVGKRNSFILINCHFIKVLAKMIHLFQATSSHLPSMTSRMQLGASELIVFLAREVLDTSSKDGSMRTLLLLANQEVE